MKTRTWEFNRKELELVLLRGVSDFNNHLGNVAHIETHKTLIKESDTSKLVDWVKECYGCERVKFSDKKKKEFNYTTVFDFTSDYDFIGETNESK